MSRFASHLIHLVDYDVDMWGGNVDTLERGWTELLPSNSLSFPSSISWERMDQMVISR
jgi:hypothetical protein